MIPVTEAEVLRIARDLLSKGEKVSINKIRAVLGHGSYSTIMEILDRNGIKTVKTRISRNSDSSADGERLEVLRQLQKTIIKEQCHNESLKTRLHQLRDTSVIENIVLLNLVKTILVKHLSPDSEIIRFLPEDEIKWKFLKHHGDFARTTVENMERMLIEDFIKNLQTLKNNVHELHLNGDYQSLTNIEKMLKDLLNRSRNDGVYNY